MPTTTTIRADSVMCGDLIDLAHDPHADPEQREHIFAYEYARVVDYERETDDCIRIDFEDTSIGFPPDHELVVGKLCP
jgi:hypothetical protein